MRDDPPGSQLTQRKREPRIVIGVIYPFSSIYLSNRTGLTNVPGNVVQGCVTDISSSSQTLYPSLGRASVGNLSFSAVDIGGAITAEFREQLTDFDAGVGRREIRLFTGDTDNFSDGTWSRVLTYVVDSVVEYDRGSYRFSCSDTQRELRERIFTQATTRLLADITTSDAVLSVESTVGFDMLQHTASFSDAPSQTVGYVLVKKTGEVIRYTGKTSNTFTGCQRVDVFGTTAQAVDVDEGADIDQRPEVEEVIYLELPAPQLIYAIMAGTIIDTAIVLPDSWNLGIPTSLVEADMFRQIGTDLYDPADPTAGLVLFFSSQRGLKETDGKRFIEEQIHRLMGTFSPISAMGKLGLRRLVRVLSDAAPSVFLSSNNIVEYGSLEHRVGEVVNRVRVKWNHDGEDFSREDILINQTSISSHGVGKTMELELIGLNVARHTEQTLRRIFNSIVDRYGSPPQELSLRLSSSMNRLEVGDTARVALGGIRDYAGTATLDRSFEIQSRQMNWLTGEMRVGIFGSTHKADPDQPPSDPTPPLSDDWYTIDGAPLSNVLTIVANHVTANGNIAGNVDLRNGVYYHLGDLTFDAGVTITTNLNAQLRVRGTVTVNGRIDGVGRGIAPSPDPNTVGLDFAYPPDFGTSTFPVSPQTFGSTRASAGIDYFSPASQFQTFSGLPRDGLGAGPTLNLEVVAGALVGLPSEIRGTPGIYGTPIVQDSSGPPAGTVRAKGGAGGASGAGLLIVSRGTLAFGASGEIDLSGADGVAPAATVSLGGHNLYAGAGGGGAPGLLYVLLDGNDVVLPDLTGSFVANHGATPQIGNPIQIIPLFPAPADPWTGFDPGIGFLDSWQSAHKISWIPDPDTPGESADEGVQAPSNLTATALDTGVLLHWDVPPANMFDFVELFESIDNDRVNAVLIERIKGTDYFRSSGAIITRYYWIRATKSTPSGVSAWHPVSPTAGVSSIFGGVIGSNLLDDPFFNRVDLLWDGTGSRAGYFWRAIAVNGATVSINLSGGSSADTGALLLSTNGTPSGAARAFALSDNKFVVNLGEYVSLSVRLRRTSSIPSTDLSTRLVVGAGQGDGDGFVSQYGSLSSTNISSVTLTSDGFGQYWPTITTATPHGLAQGASVTISGVIATGAYNVNGSKSVLILDSPTMFRMKKIASSTGSYTSGGTVAAFNQFGLLLDRDALAALVLNDWTDFQFVTQIGYGATVILQPTENKFACDAWLSSSDAIQIEIDSIIAKRTASQKQLGMILTPKTAAEDAIGATPAFYINQFIQTVKRHGAVSDGDPGRSASNSAAMQQAVNSAAVRGGYVEIDAAPSDTEEYCTDAPVICPASVHLIGADEYKCIVRKTTATASTIFDNTVRRWDGATVGFPNCAFHFVEGSSTGWSGRAQHIRVRGNTNDPNTSIVDYGFFFRGMSNGLVEKCVAEFVKVGFFSGQAAKIYSVISQNVAVDVQRGFYIHGSSTSSRLMNNYVNRARFAGYCFSGYYSGFKFNACDSGGTTWKVGTTEIMLAYEFVNAHGCVIEANGCELNNGSIWKMHNCTSARFITNIALEATSSYTGSSDICALETDSNIDCYYDGNKAIITGMTGTAGRHFNRKHGPEYGDYTWTPNNHFYGVLNDTGPDTGWTNVSGSITVTQPVVVDSAAFTPTIEGSSVAGVTTYISQDAFYERTSNRVHFRLRVSWSAQDGSGNLLVGGLPFTSVPTDVTPVSVLAESITYSGTLVAAVRQNSTLIDLFSQSSGGALSPVALAVAGSLWISGEYLV